MKTVRASDLYELTQCRHRIALDHTLPREQRTPPDEATALLLARGLELEQEVIAQLGYPAPLYPSRDFATGAAATLALMREGVPGIYQAVLLNERHLALPDLLERVDGRSSVGNWHYVPGDIKAGFTPRTDQLLQVAFAGWLLTPLQERAPAEGFLILGDGRRETFSLDAISQVVDAARQTVEQIVDGLEPTEPFLDEACTRCRWRNHCLPQLEARDDLSLVDGMTRARRNELRRRQITTVRQLADLSTDAASPDELGFGLERLRRQANTLVHGVVPAITATPPSIDTKHSWLVTSETDPLRGGELSFVAWVRADGDFERMSLACALDNTDILSALERDLASDDATMLHFGPLPQLLMRLDRPRIDLRRQLRDLAPFLPVHRYTLGEIDGALQGRAPRRIATAETPAFVYAAAHRRRPEPIWRERIEEHARTQLARLRRLVRWLTQPGRPQ